MRYISLINTVLSRFGYFDVQVKKTNAIREISVIFPFRQKFVTESLLSSLMSIDGLHLVGISFELRKLLFIY